MPTTRKPHCSWALRLAMFSGKIPACKVQIPSRSEAATRASSSSRTDRQSARPLGDVNADLGDAGIHAAAGNTAERRPSNHVVVLLRYQAARLQMACIPFFPLGSRGFKGGVAGGDAFGVDGPNRRPVGRGHAVQGYFRCGRTLNCRNIALFYVTHFVSK